jgi:hemerythrin-like domain-containing protein
MPEPIKRHEALQDLSRDHHEGLLLCFKIRQGLKKKIASTRMMNYCRHFFQTHLAEHFEEEEQLVFPVLGNDHPMVQKALEQHRHLNQLFTAAADSLEKLQEIEKRLKAHIRFEERELFNEIQQQLPSEKLQQLNDQLSHTRTPAEDWEDDFWN